MTLLELLNAFLAAGGTLPDGLVELVTRWESRADDATEALTDEELGVMLDGLVGLAEDDTAGLGLLEAVATTVGGPDDDGEAGTIRGELAGRVAEAAEEEAAAEAHRAAIRGDAPEASDTGDGDDGEGAGDGEGAETEGGDGEGAVGSGDGGDGTGTGDGDGAGDGDEAGAEGAGERQPVTAGAGAPSRASRRALARRTPPANRVAEDTDTQGGARIVLAADIPGLSANGVVASLGDVDDALERRYGSFSRARRAGQGRMVTSSEGIEQEWLTVATIIADYPEDRRLSLDDMAHNRMVMASAVARGLEPAALTAAGGFCGFLEPYRGVEVLGDEYRPVKEAIPGFQGVQPRGGGVMSMAPPLLPQLAGSAIIWTEDMDIAVDPDDEETWKPCLRVDCGDPRTTKMYAIPLCLEFGVFQARTAGEWNDAWTALSLVGWARLAETRMLSAIEALSTTPSAVPTTVSATIDVLNTIALAVAGHQSRHRIRPGSIPYRALLPETLRTTIRIDLARALRTGSFAENLAVADATIDGFFRAMNVTPTWSPDLHVVGAQASDTELAHIAPTVNIALFPEGTFAALDGGELDVGVVRDRGQVRRNDFMTFVESWEAVHHLGSEAYWLTIDVCPSGAQMGTLNPEELCAAYAS